MYKLIILCIPPLLLEREVVERLGWAITFAALLQLAFYETDVDFLTSVS